MRSILKRTAASKPCQLLDDAVRPAHVWRECAYEKTTEAGKLRRALEEVGHLTTCNVLEGEPWGWEQVTVQRIKRIAAVVKTALEEGTE